MAIGYPGFASVAGPVATARDGDVIGWDIGGAHVKACLLRHGQVHDVAQWACPLWQGLDRLDAALQRAALRWPAAMAARHAVTMTGEMVDLFQNREDGVRRIAETLLRHWPAERVSFFAGAAGDGDGDGHGGDGHGDSGHGDGTAVADWCGAASVARRWPRIASANWLATALHLASSAGGHGHGHGDPDHDHDESGLLVDIGSTTTDIVAFSGGRVLSAARSDAERLASGELVYHGVVRTPLCALGPQIAFGGIERNLINELFATTADVYRLTGELNPDHDLHPAADNAAKDLAATQQRLARMIGFDANQAPTADWLALARRWRERQIAVLRGNLDRVAAAHGLSSTRAVLVSAGCGDFLAAALAAVPPAVAAGSGGDGHAVEPLAGQHPATAAAWRCVRFAQRVGEVPAGMAGRIQLCAPSVAVALLFQQDHAAALRQPFARRENR